MSRFCLQKSSKTSWFDWFQLHIDWIFYCSWIVHYSKAFQSSFSSSQLFPTALQSTVQINFEKPSNYFRSYQNRVSLQHFISLTLRLFALQNPTEKWKTFPSIVANTKKKGKNRTLKINSECKLLQFLVHIIKIIYSFQFLSIFLWHRDFLWYYLLP